MSKLSQLIEIPQKEERQKVLLEYAKQLRINVAKVKNQEGQINEEELVVLIYDAEQGKKTSQHQNMAFLVVGIFVALALFALIFLLSRLLR